MFRYQGQIYRYLNQETASRFQKWQESGLLANLTAQYGFIDCHETDIQFVGYDDGTILWHPEVWPVTYAPEWPTILLWRAARQVLDIVIAGNQSDLTLQDAHPWNTIFDGVTPVFVDATSLKPTDPIALWPAHDQFNAFFLRPLSLMQRGLGGIARILMINTIDGVTRQDYWSLLNWGARVSNSGIYLSTKIERFLSQRPAMLERVRQFSENSQSKADKHIKHRFLMHLDRRLEALKPSASSHDVWSSYYKEIPAAFDQNQKLRIVEDILKRNQPRRVVDLGCNTGVFSVLAARQGARILSIDTSEACLERLIATADQEKLKITPIIANLASPTPPHGSWTGGRFPGLTARGVADASLCLGVMHHLILNGQMTLESVARLVAHMGPYLAIFEYISLEDANIGRISGCRPINYTFETLLDCLKKFYSVIITHPSDRETRKILECKNNVE